MFIDEIRIHLKAGKGGDGVVRWRHEKGISRGGPTGGNGGKGGDIQACAVRDMGILASYRNTKTIEAGRGEDGSKDLRRGREGINEELKLPIGSRITNLSSGHVVELMKEGEKITLLKGGRGGLGNGHFKSSTNVRPEEFTYGEEGDEADFYIELLLVVDLGLIGLPNAGKSSLLNALTGANQKIGDYAFTTLNPSLGMLYGVVLADIPGLIEGAAEGKGLGHKFLRHIERTKGLIHCISSEIENPVEAYKIVRNELSLYNKAIMGKPEVLLLTKTDTISGNELEAKMKKLKKINSNVQAVSVLDDASIKKLSDFLTKNFSSTGSPQANK